MSSVVMRLCSCAWRTGRRGPPRACPVRRRQPARDVCRTWRLGCPAGRARRFGAGLKTATATVSETALPIAIAQRGDGAFAWAHQWITMLTTSPVAMARMSAHETTPESDHAMITDASQPCRVQVNSPQCVSISITGYKLLSILINRNDKRVADRLAGTSDASDLNI